MCYFLPCPHTISVADICQAGTLLRLRLLRQANSPALVLSGRPAARSAGPRPAGAPPRTRSRLRTRSASVTKRVALGELSRSSRNCGGRLVYRTGSRRSGGPDRTKPRRSGSLRPGGSDAGALHFEADISGSESNRGGCSCPPRATLSNSRALWLTDPLGLAAGLLSGCSFRRCCGPATWNLIQLGVRV